MTLLFDITKTISALFFRRLCNEDNFQCQMYECPKSDELVFSINTINIQFINRRFLNVPIPATLLQENTYQRK